MDIETLNKSAEAVVAYVKQLAGDMMEMDTGCLEYRSAIEDLHDATTLLIEQFDNGTMIDIRDSTSSAMLYNLTGKLLGIEAGEKEEADEALPYTRTSEEENAKISEIMKEFEKFMAFSLQRGYTVRLFANGEPLQLYYHDDYPGTILVDKYDPNYRNRITENKEENTMSLHDPKPTKYDVNHRKELTEDERREVERELYEHFDAIHELAYANGLCVDLSSGDQYNKCTCYHPTAEGGQDNVFGFSIEREINGYVGPKGT